MPVDMIGLGLSLMLSAFHAAADGLPLLKAQPPFWASMNQGRHANPPSFRPQERAVSNWRSEATWGLVLPPSTILRLAGGQGLDGVSRCVKLNNYWCIKKAGWNGEIASDAQGHVAFASALEGATVAALLLRRYYVDYNRHSAFAIISRWAPAQCGGGSVLGTGMALRDVAPRGIQNTLRARWLASHGRPGFPKRGAMALRRSVVPNRVSKMMPAPEIAVGMGERDIKLKPFVFNLLGSNPLGPGKALPALPLPSLSCAGDGPRIDAYAQHAAAGVAPSSNDDLHLFDENGAPTPHLAEVMRNMAAVEIGPLSARDWLIEAGIAAAFVHAPPAKPQPDAPAAPRP